MAATDAPLRIEKLSVSRRVGPEILPILQDVDLEVAAGQWLAVLGANGSGKSSLLKYLASGESPWADTAAIMFQDPDEQLIGATVAQELALGRPDGSDLEQLAVLGLAGAADLDPRLLSAGQKQRLILAVALQGDPGLLLCDEPTALQDPIQARWVLDRLDRWRSRPGRRLITTTQNAAEAARADHLLVLADGRVAAAGPRDEMLATGVVQGLLADPELPVVDTGREGGIDVDDDRATTSAPPALTLRDVGCNFAAGGGFAGVNLDLPPGQRLGLTGANGCGKSTLLAACCGARRPDTGRIELVGRRLYTAGALDLAHGAALLAPQFPEYLFTRSTVADEIAADPHLAKLDQANPDQASRDGAALLEAVGLPPELLARHPHGLSSGQRRRLALALVLQSGRPLLLLDEPSAALDRTGRQAVLELLQAVPATTAVVVASHDWGLLTAAGCSVVELGATGLG